MKDNELVPIEITHDALNKQHHAKKNKRGKGFIVTLLFFSAVLVVAMSFPKIKLFFKSNVDDFTNTPTDVDSSSDSSTIMETDSNTNSDLVKPIPNDSYKIIEESFLFSSITNNTELEIDPVDYKIKTAEEIYNQYGKESPVVLITHFASLEAYSNGTYYSTNDNFYSYADNVASIGKSLCQSLCKLGVNAIHMNEVFANGGIYSSKDEFEKALASILKKFPSIEYVFDISRDIIINDDLTMIKPICTINNQKAAQLQIWVGTNDNTELWQKNLSFATMLSSKNEDIVKSVILSPFSYSSELCPIYLKLDVGAYSNTYNEALILSEELSTRIAMLIR